jgi:hypothetical protein
MRRLLIPVVFLAALAAPPQAVAARFLPPGPAAANQYVQSIPAAEGQEVVPPTHGAAVSGSLPFTGEDVLLILLIAMILSGVGFTVYRQTRDR